jgi:hypothetical protein
MAHFWLGLIAGITIGLIVEWLFDWRAWNAQLARKLRPSTRTSAAPTPVMRPPEPEMPPLPPPMDNRSQPPLQPNKDE